VIEPLYWLSAPRSGTLIVRIVAPVVSWPTQRESRRRPAERLLNSRRPAPGTALVSAAGP